MALRSQIVVRRFRVAIHDAERRATLVIRHAARMAPVESAVFCDRSRTAAMI